MNRVFATAGLKLALVVLATTLACQPKAPPTGVIAPAPAQSAQNPSPMVETARKHERILPTPPPGIAFKIDSVLARPVDVFIPERSSTDPSEERTLLVHLFSAAFVPRRAVADADKPYVLALVNMGGGSSAYERPFSDTTTWPRLLQRIRDETASRSVARSASVRLWSVHSARATAAYVHS